MKRENANDLEINGDSRNIDGEADGSENCSESLSNLKSLDRKLSKLSAMRNTIGNLETSLKLSRSLETKQLARFSLLKVKNWNLLDELRDADKRNKNMLNLFRSNVTDFGFESIDDLPWNVRIEVRRVWHQKYDAMLQSIEEMKREMSLKDTLIVEKSEQIDALEKRLLSLAENFIEREKTLTNVCTKYLALKKRKDEQEFMLRGSIETLQDALQKASFDVNPIKSSMTLIPSKEALLARETRRSDRLARENFILRGLLQDAKRRCTCSVESFDSCSSLSLSENF